MKMLSHIYEHKSYVGHAHWHADESAWIGLVAFHSDLHIEFRSPLVECVEREFQQAVDSYLERCKAEDAEPEDPISMYMYKRGFGAILGPDELIFLKGYFRSGTTS